MDDCKDENEKPIHFEIAISGSAYLGTIFFIWGNISKSFAMEVSAKGFEASAVNESNTIHVQLIVPEEKLLYFHFNKISDDVDSVIASFASSELQSALPPSGKFITTFIMFHNDFKRMHYIRSMSSDRQNMSNMSTITPRMRGNTSYSVGEIPDKPITKILVSELVSAISSIVKEGTPTTVFTMYKEGMRMHGVHSSGVEKGVAVFGNIDEEFEAENVEAAKKLSERLKRMKGSTSAADNLSSSSPQSHLSSSTNTQPKFVMQVEKANSHCIVINTDCIKSLGRLRTACPEGSIVSIYYRPGTPVILECPGGVFGRLIFRIRSHNLDKSAH